MNFLFWFFLGIFTHILVNNFIFFFQKVKFINDVRIFSFELIAFAFEQLVFTTAAKYLILESDPNADHEKIKLFKNHDEASFAHWKNSVAAGLKESVPPHYRAALEIENWDDIMQTLEQHYTHVLRGEKKALQETIE